MKCNETGSAGIAELAVFHPVDTIAKRLMSNTSRVSGMAQLNSVIFKDKATAPVGKKFFSLFPGLGYAAGYKVSQRIYKYGGQPIARDYLAANYGKDFEGAFGKKTGKAIMHSTAGRYVCSLFHLAMRFSPTTCPETSFVLTFIFFQFDRYW